MMRRRRFGFALLFGASCLAACGVPTDSGPRGVPSGAVPADFAPSTLPVPSTSVPGPNSVEVYFVADGRLQAVRRRVADAPSLDAALRQLFRGPTGDEIAEGLTSVINGSTTLTGAVVRDGVAVLDLSPDFVDVTPQDAILGVAEVVYTATGIKGIDAVRILVEGRSTEVPRADGTLTGAPVGRADYFALVGQPAGGQEAHTQAGSPGSGIPLRAPPR